MPVTFGLRLSGSVNRTALNDFRGGMGLFITAGRRSRIRYSCINQEHSCARVTRMARSPEPRWLLLMHQIPPHPGYLRVKIGRRLVGLGAVAVKNSIYVLPKGDQALEDFQWVRREIVAGGGDASVCEARFVEGLSDEAVEALFQTARAADY